jgi:hypothetical protein
VLTHIITRLWVVNKWLVDSVVVAVLVNDLVRVCVCTCMCISRIYGLRRNLCLFSISERLKNHQSTKLDHYWLVFLVFLWGIKNVGFCFGGVLCGFFICVGHNP